MIVERGNTNQDVWVTEIDADCEVVPQFNLDPDLIPAVSHVDLSFNRILTLSGLEVFPNLESLIMDNNCLTDEMEIPLMRRLRVLSLNKNYILDLDRLLKNLQRATPRLRFLSLLNNPACPTEMENSSYTASDYKNYRMYVIKALPTLRFLDSQKVSDRELAEASGRISPGPLDLSAIEELFPTQIWRAQRAEEATTSKYGKILTSYHGRNSEGNRFIRNNDL
ncbi:putative Leucine-rich repeat-containing protein C10orf11-like protein [Hypsibius exemplaris]|uniref:Leucine-rich repeat-containing protein C10orf11-like protein n=1 Tax=Hypsibius exemplaris TaxID=2072580 RepID=A0A1W0XFC9_HYPEX|nr:putative Leucine-rich repeat-containing protein C10orf11-like protein [Hypsibius exemplaris]